MIRPAPTAALPSRAAARLLVQALSPRWLAAHNQWRHIQRRGRIGLSLLATLGTTLWIAVFALFHRALSYLLQAGDFGTALTYKLLGMILVAFFSVALFSNVIAALSLFYLSRDLDRLVAAPLPAPVFFGSRFLETAAESSWMVLLFAVPAFLAFGISHGAGPSFYLLTLITLPPFLLLPACVGVLIATLLVTVLPARRVRDLLVLFGIVALAVVYVALRVLQPERLMSPEGVADFVGFLTGVQAPAARWLPSTWATEILHPSPGAPARTIAYYWALLATTAALATLLAEATIRKLHLAGWSKAQEGHPPAAGEDGIWQRLLVGLTRPFGARFGLLLRKEIRLFFRDSSQSSQLILLLSLVVVYVYNFSVLPLAGGPLVTFYFRNVIAFLNLALAAMVTAAVAVRFVYPSFSLEGRAFWILQAAPLDLRLIWWSKFWVALVPMLVLGEVLVLATNHYLEVIPLMYWLSAATILLLLLAIVPLGLCLGVMYPRFHVENPAKIASGFGGVLYMVSCMLCIGVVVLLEAWPVYAWFSYHLAETPIPLPVQLGIGLSLTTAVAICLGIGTIATHRGLERLRRLEL